MHLDNNDLTVGVMGGMGPYATLGFFQCILDNTPAQKDWDHLHIIIDNNPKIPSRTRAYLYNEESPVPQMIRSAKTLQDAGADFLVLPCNSAHYFLPEVRKHVNIPFIDMVSQTCEIITSNQAKIVGLLAGEVTVGGRLYEGILDEQGVRVLQVSDEEQLLVRDIIEDVKQNAVTDATREKLLILINLLTERGAEIIILGCTELQTAIKYIPLNHNIVDSLDVLAKAVIQRAMHLFPTNEVE